MKRQKAGVASLVYAYGALPPTKGAADIDAQMLLAHRYYNALVETERTRQSWAGAKQDGDAEAWDDISKLTYDDRRRLRGECGVFWGTYLLAEDAFGRACKDAFEPHFRRWDGSGAVGVQFQKTNDGVEGVVLTGISLARLFDCSDPRASVAIDYTAKRPGAVLRIRVGGSAKTPTVAEIPFIYHRPLPDFARVKYVRVHRWRVATHFRWSVQFVLEAREGLWRDTREIDRTLVAIDIGWRKMANGDIRAAAWVDSDGRVGSFRIPVRLMQRWTKTHDLRSIRDRMFDGVRPQLGAYRATGGQPEWWREATDHCLAWKAQARLAALMIRWRTARWDGDEVAFAQFETWRKQDKHLYEWECNQRENVLAARRDLVQRFALAMARYRRVVAERFDLRDVVEKASRVGRDGEKIPSAEAAQGRRFFCAPSEVLNAIAEAVRRRGGDWSETVAAWTTQHCFSCAQRELFDAGGELHHTCSHCGVEWDQDMNAARNLLRAVQCGDHPADRSRGEVADTREESPGRRAVGLTRAMVGRGHSRRSA